MVPFSRFTRYFTEVAKSGSIRKASEALHVSPSAIDRQLLQAEEALGVPLFERIPGGLRLTAAGELFTTLLQRWHKDYARALVQLEELQGLRRGHVQVAVIDALAEGMVPAVIAALARTHPGITVGVDVLDNEDVARRVAAGDVDVGLLLWPASTSGLQAHASLDVPLGIVVPPGHPLARRRSVSLTQTLEFPTILPGPPLVIHERTLGLYRRSRVDVERFMSCNNTRLMRSLIFEGVGIGVLSRIDVATEAEAGTLVFVPLEESSARAIRLSLCTSAHGQPSRAAREVVSAFESAMQPRRAARPRSGRGESRKSGPAV